MKCSNQGTGWMFGCVALLIAGSAQAQDWPQWRGPNRDAKATGFTAPTAWPKELTKKWKITVGDGVATPALVGDKLYVFSRQDKNEVIRCVNAADGKEIWQDTYEAGSATGPAASYSGPRCSPTVADGKVVTLGVRGTLSCYDTTGKMVWRKDDFKDFWPTFFTSSSPIIVDGLCIAELGGKEKGNMRGKENGGIVAYDLATGTEKWKWTGDGPAYASPVLLTIDGTKVLVAETAQKVVGIGVADGKLLFETPFEVPQGSRGYNAATPIVDGQTVIYSGAPRGTKAIKVEKKSDGFAAKELWSNPKTSVQFNTPVLTNGQLYGLTSTNEFFCMSVEDGKTSWTAAAPRPMGGGGGGGGMRMGGGYGSIVDAGSVLLGLTPAAQLIVFEPNGKEYKEIAKYKVADGDTHAYPILSGNRLFIKDKTSLTLWTIE